MKKLFLLFFLLCIPLASAIIFVPPMIYMASLSIAGFITNILIALAVWLAVKGLLNREYFGKSTHELAKIFLDWLGKALLILMSTSISILIIRPISLPAILLTGLLAALIGSVLFYVDGYREFRLLERDQKRKKSFFMLFFALIIFIATVTSAWLSLDTQYFETTRLGSRSLAEESSSTSMVTENSVLAADADQKYQSLQHIWFYPKQDAECKIYFNDQLLFSEKPDGLCYYQNGQRQEEILCPIALDFDVLKQKQLVFMKGTITARGSCDDKFDIIVGQEGFVVERGFS